MKMEQPPSLRDQLGLRKRVSIVWTYFEKLNRYRVRCRLCRHEQNYQGTTGNILRHLKNKHNIDATVRGRQLRSENLELEVLDVAYQEPNNEHEEVLPNRVSSAAQAAPAKSRRISYGYESDVDPYAESTIHYKNNANQSGTYAQQINIHQPERKTSRPQTDQPTPSLEEDRIMAEIEYFREKTAYYRMLTNLAALQAKKIKYELDR